MAIDVSPAWVAVIGTVFGGVGLKMVEGWLNKSARKEDEQKQFRDEYRLQIDALKVDLVRVQGLVNEAEAEADKWRGQFWELREQYAAKSQELIAALQEVRDLTNKLIDEKGHDEDRPSPPLTPATGPGTIKE